MFLIHSLALNATDAHDMKAEESKIDSVFDASKIPPKDLAYVAQQVIEVLESKDNWESPLLLRFLLQALDLCPHNNHKSFKPLTVFTFVLNRLVVAGRNEDIFSDADNPVKLLATLLGRAAFLKKRTVHGQQALATWWNGIRPDTPPLSGEYFGHFACQCCHETVQTLICTMVLNLEEPASQLSCVIPLWANTLLRPEDDQNVVDSQVDFMIALADQVSGVARKWIISPPSVIWPCNGDGQTRKREEAKLSDVLQFAW